MVQRHEPRSGERIAGRYIVGERRGGLAGAPEWWPTDAVLVATVSLPLLPPDSPRRDAVMSAARAAGRLSDPRFVRILDAGDDHGTGYVVSEAVFAPTLTDALAAGPLPVGRARRLAAEVADALAAAHRA